MNQEFNPMKVLAKQMFHLQNDYQNERGYEWEKDEIREELNKLRNEILVKGYDVNQIIQYQEEYQTLSLMEHFKWIRDLPYN